MKKKSENPQSRDILQNTWSVLFKIVKVMRNKVMSITDWRDLDVMMKSNMDWIWEPKGTLMEKLVKSEGSL